MSIASKPVLWCGKHIPMIGVTGKYGSGKTLFGLTIDPNCFSQTAPKTTLHWDTEDSAAPFASILNFEHRRLGATLLARKPKGYRPLDLFLYWLEDMRSIQPGRYDVMILDTASEIEEGACDYVREHPSEFGHTAAQYLKMEGLFWGDMKSFWKRLLTEVASKCQTFVFPSHTKSVWQGTRPTTELTAKGKETLWELASLYLWLDRTPPPGSKTAPAKPSGTIFAGKDRLVHLDPATGELKPILPPRLPVATPDGIRAYIQNPADYSNLKPEEQAVETGRLSEDGRLQVYAQMESDRATTEQAKLAQMETMRKVAGPAAIVLDKAMEPQFRAMLADPKLASGTQPMCAMTNTPPTPVGKSRMSKSPPCDPSQIALVKELAARLQMTVEQLRGVLQKRGVTRLADLSHRQADEIITKLESLAMEAGWDPLGENGRQGNVTP